MAILEKLQGIFKLREAWPRIERNDEAINAEIVGHKTSSKAHNAESITFGTHNVQAELQSQDQRISNIVAHDGDGTKDTEIIDARHDLTSGQTYLSLGARINALSEYLNFMPIDGGNFDGNDPGGKTIDGGVY